MSIDLTWPITSDGAGAVTYTANDWRTLLTNLFSEGVLGSGSFVVSERAAGANMTLDITAGVAVLAGDDAAGQGNYLIEATATTGAVTIGTADATNPRIDLVGIQLRDPSEGGSAGRDAIFAVEAGTAAASPSAPSVPDSFLVLAQVTVPATATSIVDANIADARPIARLVHEVVTAAAIDDLAVTTAKIAADAVTGAKIADDTINSEHYVDGSIDTAHIANGQITLAKMAANSVDSDQYVDGSIDAVHLAANAVTTAKIADDNVTQAKIADGAVGTDQLAADSVTSAKIATGAINTSDINDGAVGTSKVTTSWAVTNGLNYTKLGTTVWFYGQLTGSGTFPVGFRPDVAATFVGNVGGAVTTVAISTGGVVTGSTNTYVSGCFESS